LLTALKLTNNWLLNLKMSFYSVSALQIIAVHHLSHL